MLWGHVLCIVDNGVQSNFKTVLYKEGFKKLRKSVKQIEVTIFFYKSLKRIPMNLLCKQLR